MSKALPHVVVLQHGVVGRPTDMDRMAETLRRHDPTVVIVQPPVNDAGPVPQRFIWNRTYEGVETGGVRIAQYLMRELKARGLLPCRFSMVGYSLGGLYNRVAAGELEKEGWFSPSRLHPTCFASVASPHLGVRESASAGIRMGCLFCPSGWDLLGMTPVLDKLCQGPYLAALGKFRKRVVYGNVKKDKVVGYHSSVLSLETPAVLSRVPNCPHVCPPLKSSGEDAADVARFVFRHHASKSSGDSGMAPKDGRCPEHEWLCALSRMSWERFPVVFEKGDAHLLIVDHPFASGCSAPKGLDVMAHLSRQLLSVVAPSRSPLAPRSTNPSAANPNQGNPRPSSQSNHPTRPGAAPVSSPAPLRPQATPSPLAPHGNAPFAPRQSSRALPTQTIGLAKPVKPSPPAASPTPSYPVRVEAFKPPVPEAAVPIGVPIGYSEWMNSAEVSMYSNSSFSSHLSASQSEVVWFSV